MSLPDNVRDILENVGQVAAEVPCSIEGYREFVSVYAGPTERVMTFEERFPYYVGAKTLCRCIRFRVKSLLIEQDADVGSHDLIGLQEIYLPSENDVEFVLRLWKVAVGDLLSPRQVEIPV